MDPYKILEHPHVTEKNISVVEKENKLCFIVKRKTTKEEIKKAVEELFKVEVDQINVLINRNGKKKAIVKLKPKYQAADIAVKLGIV